MTAVATTKKPELDKLYKNLDPSWISWLLNFDEEFPVPTEIVIAKPGHYAPRIARAYCTNLFLDDRDRGSDGVINVTASYLRMADESPWVVRTYDELLEKYGPSFPSTYRLSPIRMVEVWDNVGSDGHVEFWPRGWRFVQHAALDEYLELSFGETGLPLAMSMNWKWETLGGD